MLIRIQNMDCTHTFSQNIVFSYYYTPHVNVKSKKKSCTYTYMPSQNIVFILYMHMPKSKISCTIYNTYTYVNLKYNIYTPHARHTKSKYSVYKTTRQNIILAYIFIKIQNIVLAETITHIQHTCQNIIFMLTF